MPKSQKSNDNNDVRVAYNAIVDYHNNLVQARFTVAGLVIAANGFLASAFFQSSGSASPHISLPVLAILLAVICWLLEVRTYQLLENLATRGLCLEKNSLDLKEDQGFFYLMEKQPIGSRLMPTHIKLPVNKVVQFLVSHRFAFSSLYLLICAFWIIVPFLRV